jgi:hypothetical protein
MSVRLNPGRLSRRAYGFEVDLYWVTLPVDSETSVEPIEQRIPVILLHRLWHSLYHRDPERFKCNWLGPSGEEGLVQFWQHARRHDWGEQHPALQGRSEGELGKMIPVLSL